MKNFGVKPYLMPMPVYMISTYNEDNSVDVMMMAWGGICDSDKVALNLDPTHKTFENIKNKKAFCISVADTKTLAQSDFFGIVSANKDLNKFSKTNMTSRKSTYVDAPIVNQYPVTLECRLLTIDEGIAGFRVIGEILNVVANDNVLDENGSIDIKKVNPILFDQSSNSYYSLGEYHGKAWNIGKKIIK